MIIRKPRSAKKRTSLVYDDGNFERPYLLIDFHDKCLVSTYTVTYCDPLAYEFIQQNMPEALPSLRTIQSVVHKEYNTFHEGCFRFDEFEQYLKQYKAPNVISIGEDATRVIARADFMIVRLIIV